jgi:outer membrane protein TolC
LPSDLEPALPAEALRQRPDLRAAEFDVQAAVARLLQADAARQPSFTLGGSIGASALTLASLASRAALVTSLLAAVSLPLADGGAGLARVHAQQAALAQAEASYRATLLLALQQVEDALTALRGGRQRLDHLQQAALAAADASRLARQRYDSGLVDFQVVLDTQRSRLATQDNLITAQADLGTQQLRLIQALGGGWQLAAGPGGSDNLQGRMP